MKKILVAAFLGMVCSLYSQTNIASQKTEGVDFSHDLDKVTADLKAKFEKASADRTDFEVNLKAINALIVRHQKDGNREQVARLYLLDAHIYADGLTNSDRAVAIWNKVIHDFPGTQAAKGAAISLNHALAQQAETDAKIPEGMEVGQRFPGFDVKDSNGTTFSLSAYRGKVTLIDFWATWCGPCRAEMPNVIATYNRYHTQGFEIIGVSLDENQNDLASYIRSRKMSWPQYFDGQGGQNKLAVKYKIEFIPMSYLLDRHGVIIGKGLRGKALGYAVAKALTSYLGTQPPAATENYSPIPFREEK